MTIAGRVYVAMTARRRSDLTTSGSRAWWPPQQLTTNRSTLIQKNTRECRPTVQIRTHQRDQRQHPMAQDVGVLLVGIGGTVVTRARRLEAAGFRQDVGQGTPTST